MCRFQLVLMVIATMVGLTGCRNEGNWNQRKPEIDRHVEEGDRAHDAETRKKHYEDALELTNGWDPGSPGIFDSDFAKEVQKREVELHARRGSLHMKIANLCEKGSREELKHLVHAAYNFDRVGWEAVFYAGGYLAEGGVQGLAGMGELLGRINGHPLVRAKGLEYKRGMDPAAFLDQIPDQSPGGQDGTKVDTGKSM